MEVSVYLHCSLTSSSELSLSLWFACRFLLVVAGPDGNLLNYQRTSTGLLRLDNGLKGMQSLTDSI